MSASSSDGSEKRTESTVTRGSSGGTKKSVRSVEEHFGSEVDIKVRTATGSNPRVERHFGSEVDVKAEGGGPLAPIQVREGGGCKYVRSF